jgi:hypothetical protein
VKIDFIGILSNTLELAIPVLSGVCTTGLIAWGLPLIGRRKYSGQSVLLAAGFGMLGGISGAIAGSSREALIGALISGVLGISTGVMSYAYSKEGNERLSSLMPILIFMLLFNTIVGLATGQSWRKKWDSYDIKLADYRSDYDQVYVPVTAHIRQKVFDLCIEKFQTYDDVVANCSYADTIPKE